MEQALTTIENLLRRYGHVYHANLAEVARQRFANEPAAACKAINNPDWWDGSEAIAAIDLAVDGGFTSEARQDAATLRAALTTVLTTMKAWGEINPTGEIAVCQFQKWQASQV